MSILFTTTAFAGGGSSVDTLYDKRQNQIDSQYLDIYGEPVSNKYFEKTKENIQMALNQGPTPAKKNTLESDLINIVRKKQQYLVSKDPVMKMAAKSDEAFNTDLQNEWYQQWNNKDLVRNQDFVSMADNMENYLTNQQQLLQEAKDNFTDNFNLTDLSGKKVDYQLNDTMIEALQKQIDRYSDLASFYRGVKTYSDRYRIELSTDSKDNITNIEFKNIHDSVPADMEDSGLADKNGVRIYSFIDENKNSVLNKFVDENGNFDENVWKTQIKLADPTNSEAGSLLVSPNKTYYTKDVNGNYYKMNEDYRQKLGIDNKKTIPIDDKIATLIESGNDVKSVDDKYFLKEDIRKKNQAEIDYYSKLVREIPYTPQQAMGKVAQIIGREAGRFGKTMAYSAVKVPYEIGKSFVKPLIFPFEQALQTKVGKEAVQKAGGLIKGGWNWLKSQFTPLE